MRTMIALALTVLNMRRHAIVALAASTVVCSLALASTTQADCEHWGEWAYDYRCGDSTPAFAYVTNFAGEEYVVECALAGDCVSSGVSAEAIGWGGSGAVCDVRQGVEVQIVTSLINGDTGERYIEEFAYTPANTNMCNNHPRYAPDPWRYMAIGCRIGFNCR